MRPEARPGHRAGAVDIACERLRPETPRISDRGIPIRDETDLALAIAD